MVLVAASQARDGKGTAWVMVLKEDPMAAIAAGESVFEDDPFMFHSDPADAENFGGDVAWIADVDNNGARDVLVAAMYSDNGGADRGSVYTFNMATWDSPGVLASSRIGHGSPCGISLSNFDYFGTSVADLGRMWYDDPLTWVAISAHLRDAGATNAGEIFIVKINADGSCAAAGSIVASTPNLRYTIGSSAEIGKGIATRDVDRDGVMDLLFGYQSSDGTSERQGGVHVVRMGLNLKPKVDADYLIAPHLTSTPLGNNFGFRIGDAGDVDGDGVRDMFVSHVSPTTMFVMHM